MEIYVRKKNNVVNVQNKGQVQTQWKFVIKLSQLMKKISKYSNRKILKVMIGNCSIWRKNKVAKAI